MTVTLIDGYPKAFGLSFQDREFFTDENDHNPLVIPNCLHCVMGRVAGTAGGPGQSHGHTTCPKCNGCGHVVPAVPSRLFSNDSPPIPVSCNEYGFTRCPACGLGFKHYDSRVWSGRRHSCGQKLLVQGAAGGA